MLAWPCGKHPHYSDCPRNHPERPAHPTCASRTLVCTTARPHPHHRGRPRPTGGPARAQRKAWAALVEGVAAAGGEALVFSAAHASGEQLNQLSGVAAVLRFPLPELEDAELDA